MNKIYVKNNFNKSASELFNDSLFFLDIGKNKEALAYCDLAIKKDPENLLFKLKYASMLSIIKRKDEAKKICLDVIDNGLDTSYDAVAAINIHPDFFLERHQMAEFLNENLNLIKYLKNSDNSIKKVNTKKVFVYWDDNSKMPEAVKVCRRSLREHIDNRFELIELDSFNYKSYVEIDPIILDSCEKLKTNTAFFSDLLRLHLLQKYGGFWIDSTVLLTGDFFNYAEKIVKENTFFFTYSGSRTGNWFLWSNGNSYIIDTVLAACKLWWILERRLTNYFMFHDIVEMLYWVDDEYKRNFDLMIKVHPRNSLALNNSLTKNFDESEFEDILKKTSVHKLTYKYDNKALSRNTFIKHILINN